MKVVLNILKFLVEIFPAIVSLVNSTKKHKKKDEDTTPSPEHEVVIENPE